MSTKAWVESFMRRGSKGRRSTRINFADQSSRRLQCESGKPRSRHVSVAGMRAASELMTSAEPRDRIRSRHSTTISRISSSRPRTARGVNRADTSFRCSAWPGSSFLIIASSAGWLMERYPCELMKRSDVLSTWRRSAIVVIPQRAFFSSRKTGSFLRIQRYAGWGSPT